MEPPEDEQAKAKGSEESRLVCEELKGDSLAGGGKQGQGIQREVRRQPQILSAGKNILLEVGSAFSLSRSEIVFA